MDKGIITITVDKDTTEEEIKNIRENFNKEDYRLVILVSGKDDMKLSLSRFLAARLKS